MKVAENTEQYACYASPDKHNTLRADVVAIIRVTDAQMQMFLSQATDEQVTDVSAANTIGVINSLLSTTKKLTIRPVAYSSAVICLYTSHKLVMLLERSDLSDLSEMDDPQPFNKIREAWLVDLHALAKKDAKWAKLSSSVPSSLFSFERTKLELAVRSVPDPEELTRFAKVVNQAAWGMLKSVATLSIDQDFINAGFSAAEVGSVVRKHT